MPTSQPPLDPELLRRLPGDRTGQPEPQMSLRIEPQGERRAASLRRSGSGDDFGEFFDPQEGVFARILRSEDDLDVSATATHLSLQAVPPTPSGN